MLGISPFYYFYHHHFFNKAWKTQQSKWTRYSDSTLDLFTSVLVSLYVNPIFLVLLLLDFQQMKCCRFVMSGGWQSRNPNSKWPKYQFLDK